MSCRKKRGRRGERVPLEKRSKEARTSANKVNKGKETYTEAFTIFLETCALLAVAALEVLLRHGERVFADPRLKGVGISLYDTRHGSIPDCGEIGCIVALAAVAAFAVLVDTQTVAVELKALASLAIAANADDAIALWGNRMQNRQ